MITLGSALRDVVHGDDGTAVVMVAQQVLVLSQLASAVVSAVAEAEGSTMLQLVERVTTVVGPPPAGQDGTVVVEAVVGELVELGVLADVSNT